MHRISTIDVHVAGEPLRVITSGFPDVAGRTILERREDLARRHDHLRKALMWEPRGHPDMYGCLPTPPVSRDAHLGVLFMHNGGYSTMCGHGVIGLVTMALETGMVSFTGSETIVVLDTPSGSVTAWATTEGNRVRSVAFRNVPSFVAALDERVDVPGVGVVSYDLAFGGAFYVVCQAQDLGVRLTPQDYRRIIDVGGRIKQAVMSRMTPIHPQQEELSYLYGTILVDRAQSPEALSRNVCVFADGAVDRSPTGTGVSVRMAILEARGELKAGEEYVVESLIGSRFSGRIVDITSVGSFRAIIPEIRGSGFMTGRHEFVIDPDDPFAEGFLLR